MLGSESKEKMWQSGERSWGGGGGREMYEPLADAQGRIRTQEP